MTQFSTLCGASTIKNQILFFDVHDSHFNDHTLSYMEYQYTQPFFLRAHNYVNDYPTDNGPNAKLNYLYNGAKASWMLKYGTEKNTSPHELNIGGSVVCL